MLLWYTRIMIIPLLLFCSLWLLDHVWILQNFFFFKSWINENVLFTFIHSISPLRHIFYIFLKIVRFIVLCVLSFVCMFVYTYIGYYLCGRQWMLYPNRIYQLPMEISLYSMYFEVIFFLYWGNQNYDLTTLCLQLEVILHHCSLRLKNVFDSPKW